MARFLVDASLPRAVAGRIRALGFEATDVREIGLGTASDVVIAQYAREHRLCLVTRDRDFGNIVNYPPEQYHGLVVIDAPDGAGRAVVLEMIDGFAKNVAVMSQLDGRLAVVDVRRVRLRPA
jgi:hypothetical protein